MTPAELTWVWPDTAVLIGITIAVGLAAHVLIHLATNAVVRVTVARAERHRDEEPSWADRMLDDAGLRFDRTVNRTKALAAMLQSVGAFVVWAVVVVTILAIVGIPLGPLLASAGVGGLAIGFGAQSLVKDLLAGIFMITEDQYGVGDYVDVLGITGTVEDITLRVTRIRDWTGKVHYVRNGEIVQVGNHTQGWTLTMIDVPVHYDTNVGEALELLRQACEDVGADERWSGSLLAAPEVLGVQSTGRGQMLLRAAAKCRPDEHWGMQRALRRRAKELFDDAGIRGPEGFEASA